MECTNLVDPHQLLCPWFTVVFVLFCIYTPTICSQDWLSTKSEVYFGFSQTLKYYVIKSETCNRSFIFSGYSDDLHQWKWQPRYNWNIIEKCVKHHNPNPSGAYILIRSICHNSYCSFWIDLQFHCCLLNIGMVPVLENIWTSMVMT